MDSLPEDSGAGPLAVLSRFRRDVHACLSARGDELFERADAVLCADGPVRTLAGLWLAPEHRRTWLIITCHAQLRLARPLADDLRRPWERPARTVDPSTRPPGV